MVESLRVAWGQAPGVSVERPRRAFGANFRGSFYSAGARAEVAHKCRDINGAYKLQSCHILHSMYLLNHAISDHYDGSNECALASSIQGQYHMQIHLDCIIFETLCMIDIKYETKNPFASFAKALYSNGVANFARASPAGPATPRRPPGPLGRPLNSLPEPPNQARFTLRVVRRSRVGRGQPGPWACS